MRYVNDPRCYEQQVTQQCLPHEILIDLIRAFAAFIILLKKIFLSTEFALQRVANSSQALLQFIDFSFHWTRHGGVGQRSGTGLETPLLGWALPLKILNHASLGVDVPVFLHPGDVTSFFCFFS